MVVQKKQVTYIVLTRRTILLVLRMHFLELYLCQIPVTGISCGDEAFARELACPTCDTVLPKDGLTIFEVSPDATKLREIASCMFGLSPKDICHVMRMGLDFWENQFKNEQLQSQKRIQAAVSERDRAVAAVRSASTAVEQEKLRNQSLRGEVEALKSTLVDVEGKYAEKSKAARKVSELYEDLRKVYKRLETDLLDASRIGEHRNCGLHSTRREENRRGEENDYAYRGEQRGLQRGVKRQAPPSEPEFYKSEAVAPGIEEGQSLSVQVGHRCSGTRKSRKNVENCSHMLQDPKSHGRYGRNRDSTNVQSSHLVSGNPTLNPRPHANVFDLQTRRRKDPQSSPSSACPKPRRTIGRRSTP
jgi:hypothetical protein